MDEESKGAIRKVVIFGLQLNEYSGWGKFHACSGAIRKVKCNIWIAID